MEKPIVQVDVSVLAQYEGKYRYVNYPDNIAEIIRDGDSIFLKETPEGGHLTRTTHRSEYDAVLLEFLESESA